MRYRLLVPCLLAMLCAGSPAQAQSLEPLFGLRVTPGGKIIEPQKRLRARENRKAPSLPSDPVLQDLAFWEFVSKSKDPLMFKVYLFKFPDGAFAPLARMKLEQLMRNVPPIELL